MNTVQETYRRLADAGEIRIYKGTAFRVARATPKQVNRSATPAREQQATVAAAGSLLPLIYGRARIGGRIFAVGELGSPADLVVAYAWCLGQVNSIEAVHINDAAVPGGVTLTSYTGSATQTADSTLASAIAGYDDSLIYTAGGEQWGVAYTVARVQLTALDGWPRAAAIIQGRRVYDPRDAGQDPTDPTTWAYSANPALCAADLITSAAYGMGRTVLGLSDAADWCDDEVTTGEARCSIGLALTEPREVWEYVQLLLRYAQCWYAWEGSALRMIPDQPEATPAATITGADIEGGSLSVQVRDISRTPNTVEVRYTAPTDDPIPWADASATTEIAGVTTGDILPSQLALSMPGIYRSGEALRVAEQELARLRIPAEYRWTAYSDGLLYQPGDMVRLNISARNIDREVRIISVDRLDGGRYAIGAESYSDDLYSDTAGEADDPLPEGFEIPSGLIVIWDSTEDAPSGWTLYSSADGKWILGAGDSVSPAIDPGDTGGGGTVTVSGNTTTNGAHDDTPTSSFFGATTTPGTGSLAALSRDSDNDGHAHSYNAGSGTPQARHWSRRLIQKDGASTDPLPQHAAMLALAAIDNIALTLASPAGGLLLRAASGNSSNSSNSSSVSGGTTGSGGSHNHYASNTLKPATGGAGATYPVPTTTGSHSHSYGTLTLTSNPARIRCALYKGATGSYTFDPGLIGFWAGSLASIPTGWELVDDLTDKLIELADTAQAGSTTGADTASWTGSTNTAGSHSHAGSLVSGDAPVQQGHSSSKGSHSHTVSGSASWRPEWFALAAIRFVGT